ncbi:CSLREA domain-containing protein [Candidatus Kaiserbacteria bacterium]|nr:CSLREA domain-containing protein [Candidatus Kaiserbacteria bacterium]
MKTLLARIIVVGVALVPLTLATPALAATFTVTKTADTNDGVCDADCSLREAIGAANALAGADVVTLPAGTYTLSIVGTGEDLNATGDLDITDDLTVSGAGAATTIIDGGGIDRVLTVFSGVTVLIDAVTIQNGDPEAGAGAGGVLNAGTLTLTKSIVTDNTGENFGGGILNTGTLTLTDTTVSDNILLGSNTSGGGGGIFSSGTLTLTRSTVSGNSTIGRGGGIYGADPTITITNSTISGNTALNGGGIFNRFGTVLITHATITDNTATDNGGGIWNFGGTMTLENSIVSSNTAATPSDDCAGGITSLGHNIASDASCALGGTGDLNSTDPLLGPLQNNGGETETHALLAGSPAIDAVPLLSCTVTTDQRGITRPQGPGCDIGAFELEVCPPPLTGSIRVKVCNGGMINNTTSARSHTGQNIGLGSAGGTGGTGGDIGGSLGDENNGGATAGSGGAGGSGSTSGAVLTGNSSSVGRTLNSLNFTRIRFR